jgi:cytochrome c556
MMLLAADEKPLPVKQIMKKVHAKSGVLKKIEGATKTDPDDWGDVQKLAGEYDRAVADMPRNPSPVPAKEDQWKDLTQKLRKSGKVMEEQAKMKDIEGVRKAARDIRGQCMDCHENFRE